MKLLEVIAKLEKSAEFLVWKGHSHSFLMSVFAMYEEEPDEWLVSYFDPETRGVTTFQVDAESCHRKEENKVENPVKELNIRKPNIEMEQAVATAVQEYEKKVAQKSVKTIAILQNIDEGQVWNISLMAANFSVFNCRIDSETGKVSSSTLGQLFSQSIKGV